MHWICTNVTMRKTKSYILHGASITHRQFKWLLEGCSSGNSTIPHHQLNHHNHTVQLLLKSSQILNALCSVFTSTKAALRAFEDKQKGIKWCQVRGWRQHTADIQPDERRRWKMSERHKWSWRTGAFCCRDWSQFAVIVSETSAVGASGFAHEWTLRRSEVRGSVYLLLQQKCKCRVYLPLCKCKCKACLTPFVTKNHTEAA